jgi:uncharacterized protein YceH (UPF0502 family)
LSWIPFTGGSAAGSGHIITTTREVADFDSVTFSSFGDLTIRPGDHEGLTIEAEDNVAPEILTEIRGSTLYIRYGEQGGQMRVRPTQPVRLTLIVKQLRRVDHTGAGNVTVEGLQADHLQATLSGAGMRAPKHRQLLSEALNLGRRELALLCALMLRGPQTAGELHSRTERLHHFADLEEVESCAQKLMERQPDPLVVRLPVQPGRKEPRYAHLLSGEITTEQPAEPSRPREDRFSALEAEVGALRREVEQLREQLAAFRRQFE